MRLSITTVEAFRLWRDTGDWMSLEDLESTIRKDAPENDAMRRGKAFHAILERPEAHARSTMDGPYYEANGWRFAGEGIERVLELIPRDRVPEVKATCDIDGITLSGVADALYGLGVDEYKCTGRLDVEKYLDGFQWRAVLVMFNAVWCRYVLAQYKDDDDFTKIIGVLPLTLYRYPKLDDDVRRITNEAADFIVKRGLDDYVQDKAA